ncbi:competence protein ComEC [Yeosuana aromativorans]|uniref:Competence protein ComEC n=2 Tax=Yeosuana aromativorans TaxID=288019 RepID=A0A8J3BH08_9FLAO|nr:competence protein ComEC [Yeosuana aromativorans]
MDISQMKLFNFPFVKLTICLIAGIIIGYLYAFPFENISYLLGLLLATLTITFFIARQQFVKTIWFGIMALVTTVSIGIWTVSIHNPKNFANHYSHFISKDSNTPETITFRVREVLKPNTYYDTYIVDVLKTDEHSVSGKSILNIPKDSTQNTLNVDDIYITKTTFKPITPPLNPGQFNYKNYLGKRYIYHQLFASRNELLKFKSNQQTLLGIANNIREYINQRLKTYSFKPDELAIINALLLGQRQNISEDVYTNYANAGAIHILAISGLHIGIILIILNFLFKPLEKLRYGLFIKTILLLFILWSFAIIAGLSASVTRAVTMFSIVTIGMNLKRPTNIYNTLAISIFIILLFKPLFIFDVGFQLSYMAVFAIVSIDPYLYKLWKPKYWLTKVYWHTLTITISAQLGILPLSLYYFHQFPALFFLTNLLIIPVLGIILGFGILVILMAVLKILPHFLVFLFGGSINVMNTIVDWVAKQEPFLFKDIPFNFLCVVVTYFFIITLVRFMIKRNYRRLVLLAVAVILGQCTLIYTNLERPNNQFLVFQKSRHTLLGHVLKNNMIVASDLSDSIENNANIISDYKVDNFIEHIKEDTLNNLYLLGNKKLLVIDSLGVYHVKTFMPDYVLLRNSPKINLNRLIDSIHPAYIIADGSNYKSVVERWKSTCLKTKIPFHATAEKGAFTIDIQNVN